MVIIVQQRGFNVGLGIVWNVVLNDAAAGQITIRWVYLINNNKGLMRKGERGAEKG